MAEATSISARLITNVGNMSLYEIRGVTSTTETLTIPASIPVKTTDKVLIVSGNNVTDGTVGAVTYDDGNKRFTYTESGAADEDVRILFYVAEA